MYFNWLLRPLNEPRVSIYILEVCLSFNRISFNDSFYLFFLFRLKINWLNYCWVLCLRLWYTYSGVYTIMGILPFNFSMSNAYFKLENYHSSNYNWIFKGIFLFYLLQNLLAWFERFVRFFFGAQLVLFLETVWYCANTFSYFYLPN